MSHYKPYPAYKDSGVEWLGRVPEHWTIAAPKYFILSCAGGTTIKGECADQPGDGLFPAFSASGQDVWMPEFHYSGTALVLSAVGARCGKTFKADGCWGVVANTHCLFPQRNSSRDFIWYLTNQEEWWEKGGSAQPFVAVSATLDRLWCFPPLKEQSAIATHLDRETARIDALVAKKTRFIELLREKRQALITHAVTKGLDPNVKMKDSGVEWLGEVPEHWEVKRLKFVATVQTGIAKGKDNADKDTVEIPYLRVANVQDGYLDLDEVATLEVSSADLSRYLLQPGDVLMNEGGDFDKLGRGHVWHGQIDPCIHQNHVFAVRPHSVRPEWLNAYTSSSAAQFYFMGRSKQSTNLASISSSNLMELPVPLPGDDEQCQILQAVQERASRLDGLLAKTNRSIVLLKERRAALVTAAITGQIDLREAV